MGDAAMDLPVHNQRVDRAADIIDRGIAHDLDDAGVGVDLDFANMAAIREAREIDGLVAFGGEQSVQFIGQIIAAQRRRGDLEYSYRAVGALDPEAAVDEFEIRRRRLQYVARNLRAFGD